jgi:hypothetical protein
VAKKQAKGEVNAPAVTPHVISAEQGQIVLEACFQIEALGDELLEQARKIDIDASEEIQQVATIRAIANRVKALSYVARDFAYVEPRDRVKARDVGMLKSVVHDGAEYRRGDVE